jgi:hypothetical protein
MPIAPLQLRVDPQPYKSQRQPPNARFPAQEPEDVVFRAGLFSTPGGGEYNTTTTRR